MDPSATRLADGKKPLMVGACQNRMLPVTEAPLIALILAFFGVVLATIQDLKTREVPDSLSSGLIALGFAMALVRWALGDGWGVVVNSALGFGFGYGIGAALYFLRQWGGGDAKLLAGLGAMLGFFSSESAISVGFSNTGIGVAVGIVLFTGAIAYLSRHEGRTSVVSTLSGGLGLAGVSLFIGSFTFGLTDLFLPGYLVVVFLCGALWGVFMLLCLAWRNREAVRIGVRDRIAIYAGFVFGLIVIAAVLVFGLPLSGLLVFLALLTALSPLVLVISRSFEQTLFVRSVTPDELVLGDWLAEDVVVDGVVVIAASNPGLSALQIDELRDLWDRQAIVRILIKDGIAFVPAFLFAFLVVLMW
jgi:Flp pilus assembly protein protease CpaA